MVNERLLNFFLFDKSEKGKKKKKKKKKVTEDIYIHINRYTHTQTINQLKDNRKIIRTAVLHFNVCRST